MGASASEAISDEGPILKGVKNYQIRLKTFFQFANAKKYLQKKTRIGICNKSELERSWSSLQVSKYLCSSKNQFYKCLHEHCPS